MKREMGNRRMRRTRDAFDIEIWENKCKRYGRGMRDKIAENPASDEKKMIVRRQSLPWRVVYCLQTCIEPCKHGFLARVRP